MLVHALFLLIYVVVGLFFSSPILSACLVVHSLFVIYPYIIGKHKLDPLCIYAVYIILSAISNILIIDKVKDNTLETWYAYLKPEKIDTSVLLWAVGTTFFFAGFDLMREKKFASIRVDFAKSSNLRLMFYVMMLLILRRLFINDYVFGSLATLLSVVSLMGIVFFSRLWGRFGSEEYRRYTLILYFSQTTYNMLFAYLRSDIVMPTICIFVGYFFLGRQNRKDFISYRMLPFVLAAVVFASYFNAFGTLRGEALGKGFERFENIQRFENQETIYEEPDEEEQNIFSRTSVLPQLTNVVDLVDTKGYYNGDVSAILFIALIPRFLWPEKPLIGLGAWFAFEIGMAIETGMWYNNSINMTIQGHLFMDFGWIGLILGCTLVGGYIGLLWNSTEFHESPYNITGIIFGGYLLILSLTGMGADLQIMVTLTAYYLIFLFIKRLA